MYRIANESASHRRELFDDTGDGMGISKAIVEKDFWVCLFLDVLFHHSQDAAHFCFKGGTSLSKGYGAIRRFSEDIDLILDWRLLGYGKDEPWRARSNTQQEAFNDVMNTKTEEYLVESLVPTLENLAKKLLRERVQFSIDADERKTIRVPYPRLFPDSYVAPEIRLEIGALAEWTACEDRPIQSYAADRFSEKFTNANTVVRMVAAERTFWEKATILHKEACRTTRTPPDRYSRHYYDVYMLSQEPSLSDKTVKSVKDRAFQRPELLEAAIRFNQRFYHSSQAQYEEATLEKIRLVPPEKTISMLAHDYGRMQEMLFGDKPRFDVVVQGLGELEAEIHRLRARP